LKVNKRAREKKIAVRATAVKNKEVLAAPFQVTGLHLDFTGLHDEAPPDRTLTNFNLNAVNLNPVGLPVSIIKSDHRVESKSHNPVNLSAHRLL